MIFPVLLLVIFTAVQTAIHFHARNVAQAAASEGLIAGTSTSGSPAQAQTAATAYAAGAGDGILIGTNASATRTGDTITVTVTGQSIPIVPGLPTPTIRAVASGAVETTH